MLKRSMMARTALTAAAAAVVLTGLAAPGLASAQSSDEVAIPVPPPPAGRMAPPRSTDEYRRPDASDSQGYAYDDRSGEDSYQDRAYDDPRSQAERDRGQRDYEGRPTARADRYADARDDRDRGDDADPRDQRDYQRQMADYRRQRAEWDRQNCNSKRAGSTVLGAVAGGVLGAVVGSQMGARGVRTEAGLMGAGAGALLGGAVGNSSAARCPQDARYDPRYAEADVPPPPRRAYYDEAPPPVIYEAPPPVIYEAPPPYYYGPAYGPSVSFVFRGGGGHRHWGRRW